MEGRVFDQVIPGVRFRSQQLGWDLWCPDPIRKHWQGMLHLSPYRLPYLCISKDSPFDPCVSALSSICLMLHVRGTPIHILPLFQSGFILFFWWRSIGSFFYSWRKLI